MTDQHVIIMGRMWHHNDYAVDANSELFRLYHMIYSNGEDEWWWIAMGTEYDWPVGGTTPAQPLKKAVIKIIDEEQT